MFACCSLKSGGTGVKGSGVAKSESRPVAGFSSISLESMGKITVRQTGKESLTITAEDNILPLLESRVANGTLYLHTANNANISPTKPIEYVLEVKTLEALNLSGAGSVDAKDIQGKRLAISLSGAGEVTVAGSADALELTLSGAGSFAGDDFKTKQATVRSSGVGKAVVNVSDQLDANVSGVGAIEYIGSPQVRESISGIGTVKKR
jgi:hypothetical protein